ncbi:TlpA family protein disulfide reductase [Sedimenticola selenatireducens]|uniref:TlpA family protein disulfide reductase n=1 Tax=Sedimenticola selenatireducens TaxID=191960 RepID=UPI0004BC283D|nr:TlpA disulfide reductase family protein [Sedimenticola selenatireducens]
MIWYQFSDAQESGEVKETEIAIENIGPLRRISPPRPLPEFRFIDSSGVEHTLRDFSGKTLLVNIWATWCPPCREEMPSLDRLSSRLGGKDFAVVAISTDLNGISVVQDFFQQIGINSLETYIDYNGETENALKVPGLPTTILVDTKGNSIGVKVGPMQWDSEPVVAVINAQIASEDRLESK